VVAPAVLQTVPRPKRVALPRGIGGRRAYSPRHAVRSAAGGRGPAGPVAAFLTYGVLAGLAYWPVSPVSSTRIPGCGCHDPAQEVWFLAWPAYALAHAHSLFYTNWIEFPHGVDLATNTSMPLLGVLGIPITEWIGPVATYNLMLRLGIVLSAGAAFLVLRRWTSWTPAAFIGGLVYGFSPFMVGEGLGHAFLVFLPFPPVLFLLAERVVTGAGRPLATGVVLGLVASLQYFVSPEVLITTGLVAVVGAVIAILGGRIHIRRRVPWLLRALGPAALVFLCLTGYPIWAALRGRQHIVGPPHAVAGLAKYHADLLSAIIPTQSERIAPFGLWATGNRLTGYDITETGAYIGIPLLILLTVVVVKCWGDHRVRLATIMLVVSYTLSLGGHLEVNGFNTHVPLPFDLLDRLPVLQGAASGRFSLFSAFFLAVLLAIGLDHAHRRGIRRPDGRPGAHSGALALVAVAVCLVPLLPNYPYREVETSVPPYFNSAAADRIPQSSVVLAYPYPYTPDDQAMLWAADAHMRFRIIGGQAAIPGPNGRTTSAPETLEPIQVEAVFLDAMYGTPRIEAQVPPRDEATWQSIRQFVTRYDVGTVVVDPIGHNPGLAISYLTAALGRPPLSEGGVDVWYGANGVGSS